MCNHVSNLDPPVLLPLLPGRSSVLLKKELMRIPILGLAMRMGKFVPVERGQKREAAKASVARLRMRCDRGCIFWFFRRGLARWMGGLAFKKGPFYLAQETQAPIVPIAISGTQHDDAEGERGDYSGGGTGAVAAGYRS